MNSEAMALNRCNVAYRTGNWCARLEGNSRAVPTTLISWAVTDGPNAKN